MKISINKSYINRLNLFATGIALMILGVIILKTTTNFWGLIIASIAFIFIVTGISQFIGIVVRTKKVREEKITISNAIGNIILGIAVLYFDGISFSILPILFALYSILNGLVRGMSYYIYFKNKVNGRLRLLFESIIYLIFGITLLFSPLMHLDTILKIIGIYCFLFGFNFIKDFVREIVPQKTKNKLKRKVRITLPAFISALIPRKVLNEVNEYLLSGDEEVIKEIINENEVLEEADLEVFIHVTEDGFGVVGHVDLYYQGKIISYGNYDESSYKFGGLIGNGVVVFADREKYINFCKSYSKKTLFGYGLKLNEYQKENIDRRLEKIKSKLVRWEPLIAIDSRKNIEKPLSDYKDYASILYNATGAETFKFKSGKFKTYFGLNTNCVLLADSLIGKSGIDILGIGGIITPGSYYKYFQKEFNKRGSIVVSRTIYK